MATRNELVPALVPCHPRGMRCGRTRPISRSILAAWFGALVLCLGWAAIAAAAPPSKGCPKKTRKRQHTVKRGEVLSRIASDYGVRMPDVLRDNPGVTADALREGQSLAICLPKPKAHKPCGGGRRLYEHTVRSGEQLRTIASRYATTEKDLLKRNPRLSRRPERLRTEEVLTVCTLPQRANGARACDYRSPLFRHEVVPGEWLAEIASRYGVRQQDIRRLNPKLQKNPDYLRPGMRVTVCPEIPPRRRERIRHNVTRGETVASIAKRYDLHPRQLIRFQDGRLENPDTLRLRQTLVVWRDGDIMPGYGLDDDNGSGALVAGVQLPPSSDYTLKHPALAWGTARTVRLLQRALSRHRRRAGGPKVRVGDLSKRGGGHLPPHKSHRTGKDVDIGYVIRGAKDGTRFLRATRKNLDVERTWRLINTLLQTSEVRYIFMDYPIQGWLYDHAKRRGVGQATLDELFQYPRGERRAAGVIRAEPGHDDHFHIRFR